MKKSLIEIVQGILNDSDSDAVNSIDDTVEAQQAAEIVKNTYYLMMANRNWPHTRKLIQLEASGDLTKPNYLKLPENLKELCFLKYEKQKLGDTRTLLESVTYKEPEEFLEYISTRNSDNTNVETIVDFTDTKLLVFNDVAPTYYTSFDDTYIVADAYNATVDDTLKKAKTQAVAYLIPSWENRDDFVPDLPVDAFPGLEEEAKSTFFLVIKQMANQKAEQNSVKQQRWLSRKAWRVAGGVQYSDFGRKGRK